VDTQTRHALKQDKLVVAAQSGVDWLAENRRRMTQLAIVLVVLLSALVACLVFYSRRSATADFAFGAAMDTYSAPLTQPGQPVPPGQTSFASAAERAKAANKQFVDVATRYGWLSAGKNARYFAGLTEMEIGQTGAAEADLKAVANSHNAQLAALAKLALASLYQQTNRNQAAVEIYQQLIAKPTATVPAGASQLQLAALYQTIDPAQAKRIYAQLKNDKSAAGEIAAQKLAQK
jgi:tetratricopeptide (TPR) repeat protein